MLRTRLAAAAAAALRTLGQAACSASTTICVCCKASALPRVPMRSDLDMGQPLFGRGFRYVEHGVTAFELFIQAEQVSEGLQVSPSPFSL